MSVVTALLALLVAIGVLQMWQSYNDVQEDVKARARTSAQVVSTNVEWVLETARQALQRVDDLVGDAEDSMVRDAGSRVQQAMSTIPGGPLLYVVDEAGQTLLATDPDYKPVGITDREYFLKAKQGEPYWVSSLLVSRQNGDQIFTISKRLERNGRFAGAVIMSLSSKLLEGVWSSLALDAQSTVGLFRDDGWLVSRFPKPEGPMDLSKYVLFTTYLPAAPEGTYHAISPADGVERIVGYRRVPNTKLIALASIAIGPSMNAFWSGIIIRLIIGLPVVAALGVVVFWISRLLRRDDRQKHALSEAVERNSLLLREIHHRVKNHLTGVQGLVNVSSIAPKDKQALLDRISAMVTAYTSTYEQGDHFHGVDAAVVVPAMVQNIAASYGLQADIHFEIEPIIIEGNKGMALSLLLNEVVTNAAKYAFEPDRPARLDISLKRDGDMAVLRVSDHGRGFDATTAGKGTGSRLIRGFVAQLEGTFAYLDNGTTFEATFRPEVAREALAD